jgi:hypothetical protein
MDVSPIWFQILALGVMEDEITTSIDSGKFTVFPSDLLLVQSIQG